MDKPGTTNKALHTPCTTPSRTEQNTNVRQGEATVSCVQRMTEDGSLGEETNDKERNGQTGRTTTKAARRQASDYP